MIFLRFCLRLFVPSNQSWSTIRCEDWSRRLLQTNRCIHGVHLLLKLQHPDIPANRSLVPELSLITDDIVLVQHELKHVWGYSSSLKGLLYVVEVTANYRRAKHFGLDILGQPLELLCTLLYSLELSDSVYLSREVGVHKFLQRQSSELSDVLIGQIARLIELALELLYLFG